MTKLHDSAGRVLPRPASFCLFSKYLLLHTFGCIWFWLMMPQIHLKATFQLLLYCQLADSFVFLTSVLEMENRIGPVCLLGPGHAQIYWRANGFAAQKWDACIWFTNLWAQGLDKQGLKHESQSNTYCGQSLFPLDHAVGKTGINNCHLRNDFCFCLCNSKNFWVFIKITDLTNSNVFLL